MIRSSKGQTIRTVMAGVGPGLGRSQAACIFFKFSVHLFFVGGGGGRGEEGRNLLREFVFSWEKDWKVSIYEHFFWATSCAGIFFHPISLHSCFSFFDIYFAHPTRHNFSNYPSSNITEHWNCRTFELKYLTQSDHRILQKKA